MEPATGMTFIFVPGGVFEMGDGFDEGADDETPVHTVRLDAFYMGVTPITQEQWSRMMDTRPFKFTGSDRPAEQVNWADVQAFIQRINDASGQGRRFDLPSEAQWEYAARSGGHLERFAGGEDADAVAWFGDNSGGSTRPVAKKRANGLGLYDMSGNVWEWCRDRFREDAYRLHSRENPICREGGTDRVIRGGAWHLDDWSVRCCRRFSYPEAFAGPALGFRLVMIPAS